MFAPNTYEIFGDVLRDPNGKFDNYIVSLLLP